MYVINNVLGKRCFWFGWIENVFCTFFQCFNIFSFLSYVCQNVEWAPRVVVVWPSSRYNYQTQTCDLLWNRIISKCKYTPSSITVCALPEPHQIRLCRNRKYFIQWAVARVNSQPSVAQEMVFLPSFQVLHHDSSHKPANKMINSGKCNEHSRS